MTLLVGVLAIGTETVTIKGGIWSAAEGER